VIYVFSYFKVYFAKHSYKLNSSKLQVQNDRRFLMRLAEQHHVHIEEVDNYVNQVIEDLRKNGQFDIEHLQTWQRVERDYIKSLIAEYKNGLSTTEYEEKLLADRAHLNNLADQYRLNVEQIEEWMIAELKRLDVLPLVLYSLPQSRHLAYFLSSDLLKYFQTCEIFDFFLLLCRFGSKSYSESVLGEHSQSGLSALDEDTRRLP